MKRLLLSTIAMWALVVNSGEPRTRTLFDFDWRFINEDVAGAEKPDYDDKAWASVDLPHDFQIYGPFDEKVPGGMPNGFRPLGVGWYRKAFHTPAEVNGRRVWLDFEGVYRAPKIWVNGTLVAEWSNGYRGWTVNITKQLKPAGEGNVVVVRADNTKPETSRWYTGAGIYRHVWMIVAGDVHVVHNGTYITTPKITDSMARVSALTEVKNDTGTNQWTTLTSEIFDAAGKLVATAKSLVPIRPGETFTFRQQLDVPQPQLWSLTEPRLYTMVSKVNAEDRDTDQHSTSFGIREIRITPDGLFLNGKREFLKGFNIHHDLGCLGAAAFDRAIERRLLVMKEVGCNAVRLAHNAHAPAVLELCDRLGLLVFDEAFDSRKDQFYKEKGGFKANWAADLEWFVRRDRNHPSIFIWSVGNEGSDLFIAPDYGADQAAAMADLVRGLEPTRPVTLGLYPTRWNGVRPGIAKQVPNWREYPPPMVAYYMDVMSANYMEKNFSQDRLKYPQLAYISSESNTSGNGRGAWNDLDRDHAVGLFYWGGINYIGETHKWPIKTWTGGFVDLCGFRRPGSYDVESFFSSKPMVYLVITHPEFSARIWNDVKISHSELVSHWTFDADRAERLPVEAYSNCEEVELLLNGKSLGVKRRESQPGSGRSFTWDVPYSPGTIVAVARTGGKEMARYQMKSAGPAKALRITPDQQKLKADGQDLAHVTVEVIDADGTIVPGATNNINFVIAGAGSNAGVDNANPTSDELWQGSTRSAHQGRALLVVRSKRQPGTITVTASAEGLEPGKLVIPAE